MSEKKVVSRSTATGLGIVCIILIAGLVGVMLYYSVQVNTLNDDKNTLTNYKNQLETWLAGNITLLQSQVDSLKAPKLIRVNFGEEDNRPWLDTPYLHVGGVLLNVGSNTANNCKLHVVLYQSGGTIAKDTYIELGSINGEGWYNVDSKVYYEGSALTGWTVTPQWAS